ncbi:MAG: tRNA (adenosine(37)-N6)-threonylcarbamoyltransferase complex transferase subunit TsaD [Candidatus Omnitrophica bacterium]|nr:tRNA (adenosine(37)-N6)-threonylcarbamoyltransferase complex transferase subunit TsaD [Candidatus Omnitrophota bacterium]
MITLGIETSCDETAVAVLKNRQILSTVVYSSMHLHKKYGGVIPEIATRHHVEVISYVLKEALKKAHMDLKAMDLISVTQRPGLIGALLVGISFAKALGYSLDVPVIGIDHVIAHLWANFLSKDYPKFPFVGLVVSGGHTSLILVKGVNKYRLLGQTQDDAVGEAFDKVAKILNLGYPGGPAVEEKAKGINKTDGIRFSESFSRDPSLDFSFSGIKTAVLYHVKKRGGVEKLKEKEISEIAFGFQKEVCDTVVRKAISACKNEGVTNLAIGGGVSANSRLRKKIAEEASLNGIDFFIPTLGLCLDNAAMTAVLGYELFKKGVRSDLYMSGFANFDHSPS